MNQILKTSIATAAAATALFAASAPADAAVFVTSITIQNSQGNWLQVAEVQAFSGATNVALATNGGSAAATSVYAAGVSTAAKAIDGNTGGNYYTDTIYHGGAGNGTDVLTISFAGANLTSFSVFGRTDCCNERDTYTYTLFNGANVVGQGALDARSGPATVALGPVPEPATWAMMLAGFGLVGFGLRRRAKQTVRVAFG
jgi:hypothetical protein